VGSYLSDGGQLASPNRQQPFNLAIPLPSSLALQNTQSLAVLVLLNGLRTASAGASIQFQLPAYDQALRQINLTVLTNASQPIELLFFSYILVDLGQLTAAGYS
jgi:hypothetical protein